MTHSISSADLPRVWQNSEERRAWDEQDDLAGEREAQELLALRMAEGDQQVDEEPYDPLAPSPDVDEILATDDPPYDWRIEGLIERGDRLIVTGNEGKGKSTLLRQFGLRVASGLHPFESVDVTPVRVLYIDCENSERQVRRKLAEMREAAGDDYRAGHLRFEFRPDGIDLLRPADIAWLDMKLAANQPELLIIGPLYKMASGDPKDEQPARAVAQALDNVRARLGLAVIIEAHTPYAEGSKSRRPMRPYGASLWSRWPEFGIYLADNGDLEHWRGAREERVWPRSLERSSGWPWAVRLAGITTDAEPEWHGPTHAADAVVKVLAEIPGIEVTGNRVIDLVKAAGFAFRAGTVRAAAELAASQGRIAHRNGPNRSHLYQHIDQQETPDAG